MKEILSIEKDLGIIGHFRSMVNCMTQEYLSACAGYTDRGYDFDERNSRHICRLNLRDKFMTIDQINILYHIGEREKYRRTKCPACIYKRTTLCPMTDEDVDRCITIDEQKFYADAAAAAWDVLDRQDKELYGEKS